MGDLLQFPTDRVRPAGPAAPEVSTFFFDVSDPLSYLAAERVERRLGEVEWVAVDGALLRRSDNHDLTGLRRDAEARARELHLPLEWPDQFPLRSPHALRAAAYACELGAGPAFALAASRLAFCGGFTLDDPEILAEAAAAAAVPLRACLDATRDTWRDQQFAEIAQMLVAAGIDQLPAFCIGGRWLSGEEGLGAGYSRFARYETVARRRSHPVLPAS